MASRPLRILLDGTPLLGTRTGIGRYTASLLEELASLPDVDTRAVAFTLRGWRKLRRVLPHNTQARGMPVAARALRRTWRHVDFPQVELFAGFSDVVHGTNFVLPATALASRVLTVHDLNPLREPEHLPTADADLPALIRKGVRRADAVCTPSATVAEQLSAELDVDPAKTFVTPLGVDPGWFAATPPDTALRERFGLPAEYLLFIGGAGPRKGLDWLVEAHEQARDLPSLVFVGPGRFPTGQRRIHPGYVAEPELQRVLAGAAALILPSSDEGFGLPALEAMACDTPVVCTDIPVLREVTGGDSNAYLLPHGDVEALVTALRSARDEQHTPQELARRRSHAASYTWRRCAQATVAAYRAAVA